MDNAIRRSLGREEFRKKDFALANILAEAKRTAENRLPPEVATPGQPHTSTKFVSPASPPKFKHAAGIVRVPPATSLEVLAEKKTGAALRIARDEEKRVQADPFRGLYGFTRKEAALAEFLLQGKSIAEAATKLCISTYSARLHLKRILMKAVIHPRTGVAV